MKRLLFDTESNGFVATATKLHCSAFADVDTGEEFDFKPGEDAAMVELLDQADMLIGHNIQRHDIPLIKKLTEWTPRPGVLVRDTMVMARLIYPNVKATDKALIARGQMPPGKEYQGKHSIAAWGFRLGEPKGDYSQVKRAQALALGITDEKAILDFTWSEWNEEMHDYMLQDRKTNLSLWRKLNPDNYSDKAITLEHRVARVCDAMESGGVPFDQQAAGILQAELTERKHELEERLKAGFGYWYQPISPDPTKALFVPKRDNKKMGYLAGVPSTKIKQVQFNPSSRDHIARKLIERGWKPDKFTNGGKPALDEETLAMVVARYPEMDGIGEYLMLDKRLSMLATLQASVQEDGMIHGFINPMGTITSRAAHMFPNLGQVPSPKKPFGVRFRALFSTAALPSLKDWVFVGADQAGLELRGLAHYLFPLDGGKYMKVVIEGDPHWLHAQIMGLAEGERDEHNKTHTIVREDGSKRFIYAYIYGCWDDMAGAIIYEALLNARRNGGDEGIELYIKFFGDTRSPTTKQLRKVGETARAAFLTRIDGFGTLKDRLGKQIRAKGRIKGLDGRLIPIRSDHSALNFMIQSAGAIVCKQWLADAYEECCARFKEGWDGDFRFCLWVHDEIQVCCRREVADAIGEILVRCARTAGDPFAFRVPLNSKYTIGRDWSETH